MLVSRFVYNLIFSMNQKIYLKIVNIPVVLFSCDFNYSRNISMAASFPCKVLMQKSCLASCDQLLMSYSVYIHMYAGYNTLHLIQGFGVDEKYLEEGIYNCIFIFNPIFFPARAKKCC